MLVSCFVYGDAKMATFNVRRDGLTCREQTRVAHIAERSRGITVCTIRKLGLERYAQELVLEQQNHHDPDGLWSVGEAASADRGRHGA